MNQAVVISGKRSYANVCSYYFGNFYGKLNMYALIGLNTIAMTLYTTISWSFIEKILKQYNISNMNYIDE